MHVPFKEMLKSIPGAVGIRLEKELPYDVIRTLGDLEIRQYRPFTLARTTASGDFDSASEICFKRLADYIFGSNTENEVTEMTSPVFMDREGDKWTMSFYIPEEHADLMPKDSSITIEKKPSKEVAVYRYSGNVTIESMTQAKNKLLDKVSENGLTPISEVWWAQFDQPFSAPFTKRNEALVKIK